MAPKLLKPMEWYKIYEFFINKTAILKKVWHLIFKEIVNLQTKVANKTTFILGGKVSKLFQNTTFDISWQIILLSDVRCSWFG